MNLTVPVVAEIAHDDRGLSVRQAHDDDGLTVKDECVLLDRDKDICLIDWLNLFVIFHTLPHRGVSHDDLPPGCSTRNKL